MRRNDSGVNFAKATCGFDPHRAAWVALGRRDWF
jgi:hypothetical protein